MENAPSQKRSHRSIALAVALAAVALASAACGSSQESGKSEVSLAPKGNATADWPQADKLKYAACMRSNGVPSFPDPDASGAFTLDGKDANAPQFKKAEEACKQYQPQNIPSMSSSKSGGS